MAPKCVEHSGRRRRGNIAFLKHGAVVAEIVPCQWEISAQLGLTQDLGRSSCSSLVGEYDQGVGGNVGVRLHLTRVSDIGSGEGPFHCPLPAAFFKMYGCTRVRIFRDDEHIVLVGYLLKLWAVDCSPDHSLDPEVFHLWLRDPLSIYGASTSLAPGYVQPPPPTSS